MKVKLVNIKDISYEEQMEIREWRNSDAITSKFLIPYIDEELHKSWLESMKQEFPKNIAFMAKVEDYAFAVVYLHSADYYNKTCEIGIFMNGEQQDKYSGLGVVALYLLFEYVFYTLEFEKINIKVLNSNSKVVSLQSKLGFVE